TTNVLEDLPSALDGRSAWSRFRLVQQTHEQYEFHDITGKLSSVCIKVCSIFWNAVELARWCLVAFVGEDLVGYAHLDVVGLRCKQLQRFVLCLPTKARDRTIVAIGVRPASDPEQSLAIKLRTHIGKDGRVGNRFDEPPTEYRSRNAEDEVSLRRRSPEIRLCQGATFSIATTCDGEQIVDTAIRMPQIGCERKSRFAYRAIESDEKRQLIGCALIAGGGDLGVYGGTGAAHGRLSVTLTTGFPVEPRSEPEAGIGYGAQDRLDLHEIVETGVEI